MYSSKTRTQVKIAKAAQRAFTLAKTQLFFGGSPVKGNCHCQSGTRWV
jgi:hypothetical protein